MSVLTCNRADLAWALKAVLPHAGRDKLLPQLRGVRVEVVPADKLLYCVATDRYTVAAATVDIGGEHKPAQVTLPLAEVRTLLATLPGDDPAQLAVHPGFVLLDNFYRFKPLETSKVPGYKAPFIPWRELLADTIRYPAAVPGKHCAYDTRFLARFGPAVRDNVPLVVVPVARPSTYGHPPTAMTVVLGEHFTAAVMSARLAGQYDPRAALRRWRELLPAGGTP